MISSLVPSYSMQHRQQLRPVAAASGEQFLGGEVVVEEDRLRGILKCGRHKSAAHRSFKMEPVLAHHVVVAYVVIPRMSLVMCSHALLTRAWCTQGPGLKCWMPNLPGSWSRCMDSRGCFQQGARGQHVCEDMPCNGRQIKRCRCSN